MKKMLMVSFMILSLGMVCFAQGDNNRGVKGKRDNRVNMEERQKQMLEKMKKDLSLTEEQFAKVETLQKEQSDKRKARMENIKKGDEKKSREEMRKEMEKDRAEGNAKMKEILTEEQYTKYEKMMKENGPRGGGRGEKGHNRGQK